MSLPKKNILANYIGQAWSALVNIAFIPIYIKYMGIEAYGLVGIFATIQSLFVVVDMGLTTTMSREIAKLLPKNQKEEMYGVSKTLEYIYWLLSLGFGVGVVFSAPLIVEKWLKLEHIASADATSAIILMGISFVLLLPSSIYSGGLMGMQKQILLNKINIAVATLRAIGAIAALMAMDNKFLAFFGWQIIASSIQTLLMFRSFRKMLDIREKYHVRFRETLAKIWRFSAGVSGTTLMAIIFMQVDKIIASKYFSLKQFAYYSLASSLAAAVYKAVVPVTTVMMPRFTELIALNSEKELAKAYHYACQLLSFLIMPAICVTALFSREILTLWTMDASISENTHVLLSLLLIGTMLNSLYHIPYNLQLAYGWNKLGLYANFLSVLLVVPASIISAMKCGLIGPAVVWIIFNFFYILLAIPIMHGRILNADLGTWYLKDISAPLFASVSLALFWRILSYASATQLFGYLPQIYRPLPFIILSLISAYAITACLSAPVRESIRNIVQRQNEINVC